MRVNVRLIAATNRDIVQAIAAGQFREDLFHRLNVVQFQLPPLRERGEDVVVLAGHFLKLFRATMNKNVGGSRARHAAKTFGAPLAGKRARTAQRRRARVDFGDDAGNPARQPAGFSGRDAAPENVVSPARPGETLDDALARIEREIITGALAQNAFNLTRAAESLKLTRHSLRYRMQRLQMNLGDEPVESSVAGKNLET